MVAANRSGQISAELMVTVSSMMLLLIVIYMVNGSLQSIWDGQKGRLEASTAANQVALAINRAAAGGDGTQIKFNNYVGSNVANITISPPRAVHAETVGGMAASAPIITNNTDIPAPIPFNHDIVVRNNGGTITVEAG